MKTTEGKYVNPLGGHKTNCPGAKNSPAAGTARCARCQQPRALFPAKPEWGRAPSPLCSPCWQRYDEARANNDYADWNDAFDNAPDDDLANALNGQGDPR